MGFGFAPTGKLRLLSNTLKDLGEYDIGNQGIRIS